MGCCCLSFICFLLWFLFYLDCCVGCLNVVCWVVVGWRWIDIFRELVGILGGLVDVLRGGFFRSGGWIGDVRIGVRKMQ